MVEAFTEANSALEVLPLKDCSVWRLNFDRTDDPERSKGRSARLCRTRLRPAGATP